MGIPRMDQQEYRKILAIHGYQSSDEESDSGSKAELDDVYEKYKPSPIDIDPSRDKIIDIEASEEVQLKPNVSYSSALQNTQDESISSSALNVQPEAKNTKKNRSKKQKKKLKKIKDKETVDAKSSETKCEVMSNTQEVGLNGDIVDDKNSETSTKKTAVMTNKLEKKKQKKSLKKGTVDDKSSETSNKQTKNVTKPLQQKKQEIKVEDKSSEKNEVMNGLLKQELAVMNARKAQLHEDVKVFKTYTHQTHYSKESVAQMHAMLSELRSIVPNLSCNPVLIYDRLHHFLPSVQSLGIPIFRCCECTYGVTFDLFNYSRTFLNSAFFPNKVEDFFYQCDDIILKNVQAWSFIPNHCPDTLDINVHQGLCSVLQKFMKNVFKNLKEKMLNHCDEWEFDNIAISKYIFGNVNDFHLGRLAGEIFATRRRKELLGAPKVVQQDSKESTHTKEPPWDLRYASSVSLPSDVVEKKKNNKVSKKERKELKNKESVDAKSSETSVKQEMSLNDGAVDETIIESNSSRREDMSSMLQQKKQVITEENKSNEESKVTETPITTKQNFMESTQVRLPPCVVQGLTDAPSGDEQTSLHSDVVEILTGTDQNIVLETLILKDQTENKKYFYDCYLDEDNLENWREFQNDYLNKSLTVPEDSCNIDLPLILLQKADSFYNVVMSLTIVILFKRFVFDILYYLLSFVDVGIDIVFFIILLFYICSRFVSKF